ncbi:MAG: NUDIX domain-containing protein [Pirellulaceae bacterium]|jgi:8-oxo-dGTP pyrophosphatase MutT (NUDIX family)|nr:NUDIX domain-containing protein [Pirellulaceae bacterium]MDP7017199.1 NUDIX domain-containing protein [Pirellulaceae bacterium]
MATPEVRSCGFLIFDSPARREFLLMRHADRFDLPKGHVDGDETEMECALRELDEETGYLRQEIEIDPDFRFTLEYEIFSKRLRRRAVKELVVFLAHLRQRRDPVCTEHAGFEWRAWSPPHAIQANTIDPLLAAAADHLDGE